MNILLLEDDPKTSQIISEILAEHNLSVANKCDEFLKNIESGKPDLLLIDFDLKEKDGLLVYRDVKLKFPFKKTIMFSSSNSIPLAVQATKLGVLDFLRKPLDGNAFRGSVENVLKREDVVSLDLSGFTDAEWLSGTSLALRDLFASMKVLASKERDFCVSSGKGIDKNGIARMIHRNSKAGEKRFVEIDLRSFNSETTEPHCFLMLRELKEDTGAVYLSNMDVISEPFRESLVQYIKDKKSAARIIFGSDDLSGFDKIEIPALRSRREDVPAILLAYLRKYAPQIRYIDPKTLEFLMFYDFPGNYEELRCLVESAASSYPGAEVLNMKSLPLDMMSVSNTVKNRLFSKERYDLLGARDEFDRALFDLVLSKVNNDTNNAAKFLEVPHTQFLERSRSLGLR